MNDEVLRVVGEDHSPMGWSFELFENFASFGFGLLQSFLFFSGLNFEVGEAKLCVPAEND